MSTWTHVSYKQTNLIFALENGDVDHRADELLVLVGRLKALPNRVVEAREGHRRRRRGVGAARYGDLDLGAGHVDLARGYVCASDMYM